MALKIGYFNYQNGNPFQHNFFNALANDQVAVTAIQPKKILRSNDLRDLDVIHLDWLHPLYKNRNWLLGYLKYATSLRAIKSSKPDQKFVHVFHNIKSHDSFLREGKEIRMIESILMQMDGIFGFTNATLQRMTEVYPRTKSIPSFVVPHGHYIDNYPPLISKSDARKKLQLPLETKQVLFFGGLRENKGIEDLLKVFPDVYSQTGAKLLVVGRLSSGASGDLIDLLETPSHWLKRHDQFVPDSEVPLFFSAADIVVLPFRDILNSGSAILAASMGKCIVLPNIDSLTEALNGSSIFKFEKQNLSSLKKTLIEAAAYPSEHLNNLGLAAKQHVKVHLAWDKIGSLARLAYQKICDND